eukprot:13195436-Ditylum_brightwellii.AAC.1
MDKCTMANLAKMVQCLSVETSDKYVFEPAKNQHIEGLTLALQDFARLCRWREFWHTKEIERLNSLNPYDIKFKKLTKNKGLGTGLRLENYKPKGPQVICQQKIVVPTDKANGHRLVAMENYIKWVNDHMQRAAQPIKRELLNEDELGYLLEKLKSRTIPEP